jgi:hypothetical protein
MGDQPTSPETMQAYRESCASSCLSNAAEASKLLDTKLEQYPKSDLAFFDAYQVLNNIKRDDPDVLRAITVVDSYRNRQGLSEAAAGINGQRIVESLAKDDDIIRVAGHVQGMLQAAQKDPREYFKLALSAARSQYELHRRGEIGGNEEDLMARYARLNAAVLELENI